MSDEIPSGICQNCRVATAELVTYYGHHYCKDCNRRIERQLDQIADLRRFNRQLYGNEDGSINIDEYWGRENKHDGE